ncbi:MAG: arsenite S-adenosylmethyltransferase, partial [Acidimicrobiales bacterium]
DKDAVARESLRVLKPGGRLAISDVVLRRPLAESTRQLIGLWTGCVAGALVDQDYFEKLRAAGFEQVSVTPTRVYELGDITALADELVGDGGLPDNIDRDQIMAELDGSVMSAFVRGRKP